MRKRLAVFTAIYPAARRFLRDWQRSVLAQTDTDFELWIALDGMSEDEAQEAAGVPIAARWLPFPPGSSPAQIRSAALERLAGECGAVVLTDCDDILDPTRVEAARGALASCDVAGCALRLIGEHGQDLGVTFGPQAGEEIDAVLPRCNAFGLSNSAFRCETLRRCLPAPESCVLIDWFFATRAWLAGARMAWDPVPRMAYRRYGNNTAPLSPYTPGAVLRAAEQAHLHYRRVLQAGGPADPAREAALRSAGQRAEAFLAAASGSAQTLERYVRQLNQLEPRYLWWWCVAHPDLDHIWKT